MSKKTRIKINKKKSIFLITLGLILGVILMNSSISSAKYNQEDMQMNKIENSPQYRNGKFRNHNGWERPSISENVSTMWDFLFTKNQRTPGGPLPVRRVDPRLFNDKANDQLKVAWLGHSSLLINIDGYKILTDPVFEKRISILGPTRYNGNIPLDINLLPEIDVVIISHNHYDHFNKFSIQQLKERVKKFIVPLMVGAELQGWGVPREKIVELDWWEEYHVDKNLLIAATPSQHFSGRGLSDLDETLWASWVVRAPKHKIFFSGDSGYFTGFKKIGEKYGPFDITFIECGAYNKKWKHIHMLPEETVRAHLDLRGKILHPIHWGTYNLALHSWYEPIHRLTNAAESLKVRVASPVVGETTVYDEYIPSEKWWEDSFKEKIHETTKMGCEYHN